MLSNSITPLALSLALTACSPLGLNMNTDKDENPRRSYRVNPNPKQGYWIRMVIENAPGPFAWKLGLAQYDVSNPECLRPPKDNPGGRSSPLPTKTIEIPLTQVSENEYEALVYADYMLDEEDYTGRGVCHWELMQFRVHLRATGTDGETLFIPAIPNRKLVPLEVEAVYFNKRSYPRADMDNFPRGLGSKHLKEGYF